MKIGIFKEKYKTALITFRTYQETKDAIKDISKRLDCSDSDTLALAVHIMSKRTTSDLLRLTQSMYLDQLNGMIEEGGNDEKGNL